MYSTESFLNWAKKTLKIEISQESINEANAVDSAEAAEEKSYEEIGQVYEDALKTATRGYRSGYEDAFRTRTVKDLLNGLNEYPSKIATRVYRPGYENPFRTPTAKYLLSELNEDPSKLATRVYRSGYEDALKAQSSRTVKDLLNDIK